MKHAVRGIAAAVMIAVPMASAMAQDAKAADAKPAAATPAPAQSGAISNFVKCDGRKGHAGFMEKLGQIVAITATAGISGALTNDLGSVDKRLSGLEGVAACDAALAEEGNEHRRAELGIAKAIHFIEAGNLDAALTAARAVPTLAGKLAEDSGFRMSLGAAASVLEADILLRKGQPRDAELAAARASNAAGYEVAALQKIQRYLLLTDQFGPEKRKAMEFGARVLPQNLQRRAEYHGWAGEYREAAEDVAALFDIWLGILGDEYKFGMDLMAERAAYLAVGGDMDASNKLAEEASGALTRYAASADAEKGQVLIARADELLAFQRIVRLTSEGNPARARQLFGARERWLYVPDPLAVEMTRRLRQGAPADALVGILEQEPDKLRQKGLATRAAAITDNEESVKALYTLALWDVSSKTLAGSSNPTWKTGAKPRFLLKPSKKDKPVAFEILSTDLRLYGREAGVALLLHAALIAKDRQMPGFVVAPLRKATDTMYVRFGTPGTPGFPVKGFVDAAQTIKDLTPLIPQPAPAP